MVLEIIGINRWRSFVVAFGFRQRWVVAQFLVVDVEVHSIQPEAINAYIYVNNDDWSKAIMMIKIEMVAYEKWTVKEITIGTKNGPHMITDSATKCTHTSAERGKTRTTYTTAMGLKEKYMIQDIIARGGARITFTAHYDVDVGFDLSNKALKHLRDVFLVYDGLCGRYN